MVTRGDSSGKSKTDTPLTSRIGRGAVRARCTRSLTASPSVRDLLAAYRLTRLSTASSRVRVVLIVRVMLRLWNDVNYRILASVLTSDATSLCKGPRSLPQG